MSVKRRVREEEWGRHINAEEVSNKRETGSEEYECDGE